MSIWWDRYLWIHSQNISWPTNVLRGKHYRTSKADSVKLWEFRQIVVRLFSVLKSRFWRPKGGGLKGSSGKWFVCWVCRIRPNVLAPFLKTLRWRDPNITTYPLFFGFWVLWGIDGGEAANLLDAIFWVSLRYVTCFELGRTWRWWWPWWRALGLSFKHLSMHLCTVQMVHRVKWPWTRVLAILVASSNVWAIVQIFWSWPFLV